MEETICIMSVVGRWGVANFGRFSKLEKTGADDVVLVFSLHVSLACYLYTNTYQ